MDAKAPLLSFALEGVQPNEGVTEELRCATAVILHGDRTPKHKVKLKSYRGETIKHDVEVQWWKARAEI